MAIGDRSAKRRKLSAPEDDADTNTADSTPLPTPSKAKLKRPTRVNPLRSAEASRSSSRLAAHKDLDNPAVYDDFDSAFGGSPARQLQSEAATATATTTTTKRVPRSTQPKKTPPARPKTTRQSDSQKENIPEDDTGSVNGETPVARPARRGRSTRTVKDIATPDAENEEADELDTTPAPPRGKIGQAPAAEKQVASTKKSRAPKKTEEAAHEEPDEEPKSTKKAVAKAKTPATPRASATKAPQGKKSLLDLVGNNDKPNDDIGETSPELVTSPVSKLQSLGRKAQTTPKVTKVASTRDGMPEDLLLSLKAIILDRVTGKERTPLIGLDDEYRKVHQLVEQTVSAGEGNSMLVIGSRGSGKTVLVNQVLEELSQTQRQDFHIIRLNGFVHTDDKLALREIWRQLGKEMDVEEDSMGKNYADTLSTLLALLSHPSELAGEESDEVAKAVIFVMDEFDLFASHPRQTLLYNLFDIAQSKKAPITVLGLTTRIGVSESLEKRVKSRFSHRYVHLSLAKSFASFQEMCKAALILRPADLNDEKRSQLSIQEYPSKSRTGTKPKQTSHSKDLLSTWNDSVTALFSSPSFLQTHLAPHYHLNKSVPSALSTFHLPIALLSPSTFPLTAAHFPAPTSTSTPLLLQPPDSKLSLLPSLSDLSLALLIAAARLDIIHDADSCNFNMAYAEYVALASRAKIASAAGGALAAGATGTKVWGREAARGEWEALVRWELLIPVTGGGGVGGGSADAAMVRCDVALEEIAPSCGVGGLDRVLERWCRQI